MDEHEDEIDLMDYLNVLWKKKWMIILLTFIIVVAVGIYSFFLPRVWEIDAIIQPSKFLIQTEQGGFEEVLVVDPKQIAGQINQASYNHLIAAELNLDIKGFPKLRAENLRDTKLVCISIREQDVEKAKLILTSLFNHLKRELDGKAAIEIKGIDAQIISNEIEKTGLKTETNVSKKKLRIIQQRKKEIEDEMRETRKRIEILEKEQLSNLKKEKRSETESLGMLLYSNEIQQNLRYYNTLNELLSSKKIEEENFNLEIENGEKRIKQLENTIENLNERKGRIDYTRLIKEPTSSLYPVSPKKKHNVMIAGILSLMIFTILAFFLEYVQKHKTNP